MDVLVLKMEHNIGTWIKIENGIFVEIQSNISQNCNVL